MMNKHSVFGATTQVSFQGFLQSTSLLLNTLKSELFPEVASVYKFVPESVLVYEFAPEAVSV